MLAAMADARDAARGHEALLVSHQLPIWTARSVATGRRLWHDPRKRQCSLASLTSFTYDGDELVSVAYEEPAHDLLPVRGDEEVRRRSLMRHLSSTRRTTCAVAAVLAAVVLAGCSGSPEQSGAPDKGYISGDGTVTLVAAADRDDVVTFTGTTLDGQEFDVTDHRGDVVVVNVWGSWCPPCIAEAPALEKVWEQTRSEDVQFVGVNTRDQNAAARAHERRFEISYPSIDDDGGRVLLAFRGTLPPVAIPSTLVLDRSGRVAARVLGKVGAGTLRGVVDDVLAEPDRSASR